MKTISHRLRRGLVLLLIAACIPAFANSQYRLCYFGDSITEGWMDAVRRPDRAFPALVDSMLDAEGLHVNSVVTAHGGATTEDALTRVDRDVLGILPDAVVFAFGSNDYFVWGEPPASRVSLDRFRADCRILFRKFTGSGVRVIVLTPPAVVESRFYAYFDSMLYTPHGGVDALREEYARTLRETAREFHGTRVLCVDSVLGADTAMLGFDGVHPTAEGHRRIASALRGAVRDALLSQLQIPRPVATMRVFPSPFLRVRDGNAVVEFSAAASGEYLLRIADTAGRLIRKMVYYVHAPGDHCIVWNARSDDGTTVAPGAYTLHLQSVHQEYRAAHLLVF